MHGLRFGMKFQEGDGDELFLVSDEGDGDQESS